MAVKTNILTAGIYLIFIELKLEFDTAMRQKGRFA
jgi:hypothetical protein